MPAPVPIRNPKVPEQRRLPIEAGGEARMVEGEVKDGDVVVVVRLSTVLRMLRVHLMSGLLP